MQVSVAVVLVSATLQSPPRTGVPRVLLTHTQKCKRVFPRDACGVRIFFHCAETKADINRPHKELQRVKEGHTETRAADLPCTGTQNQPVPNNLQ